MKSRRMKRAWYVARMEERRGEYRERAHLEDPGVDGRIILGWIFRNGMWEHGLNRYGPRQGEVAGTCEYGNEPSGSIKYG